MPAPSNSRQPPQAIVTMTILSAILTFYFMFTYSGPFQFLAEKQLDWAGQYEEKITFLFTFLFILGVMVVLWLPFRRKPDPNAPPSAIQGRPRIEIISNWIIFLVIGAGFAVVGMRDYYRASHAGPLTKIDLKQLESGKPLTGNWISVKGIPVPKASIEFGSERKDAYTPLISGKNDVTEKGIYMFLKTRSNELNGAGEDQEREFEGYATANDLPGPVRTSLEKEDLLPREAYYVLELGETPEKKMSTAKWMCLVGVGIAALGGVFGVLRKRKKQAPAPAAARVNSNDPLESRQ